jgi:hypothetical protein
LEAGDDLPISKSAPSPQQAEATLLDIGGNSAGGLNVSGTAIHIQSGFYIYEGQYQNCDGEVVLYVFGNSSFCDIHVLLFFLI